MQILVSFSTVLRFVLWLVVIAVLAGGMLVNGSADEPVRPREGVTEHVETPRPSAVV